MAQAIPSLHQRPYFAEGTEAMLQLEAMVDAVGLRNVLCALVHICHEKAEHLAVNWQDVCTAKAWTKEALRLQKAADRVDVGGDANV
jgi:hypothetical protein